MLLGEPILISSPDPRTGAEIVHHLTNLIRPVSLVEPECDTHTDLTSLQIAFAGDYRPYFHIHDTDFTRMANPTKVRAATARPAALALEAAQIWCPAASTGRDYEHHEPARIVHMQALAAYLASTRFQDRLCF